MKIKKGYKEIYPRKNLVNEILINLVYSFDSRFNFFLLKPHPINFGTLFLGRHFLQGSVSINKQDYFCNSIFYSTNGIELQSARINICAGQSRALHKSPFLINI